MKSIIQWLLGLVVACGMYVGRVYVRSLFKKEDPQKTTLEQPSGDSDNDNFWELNDDSELTAKIEPWPAPAGPATIVVEISPDDASKVFGGTLECRIAHSERNSDPWYPVKATRKDKDLSTHFSFPIKLRPGTFWVQFRVKEPTDKNYTELTDWKIEVK
jgi:hypothetical protein